MLEIERKYYIKQMPENIEAYKSAKIEQGYLCNNPIVRIRRSNEEYVITYKAKLSQQVENKSNPIINHEVELPLTKEAYDTLKAKTDGNLIVKTRYFIPISEELIAELDVFESYLEGLVFVEVEFPNEELALKFVPPMWFDKEITSDRRYSNYYLSQLSSPPIK